ncbi:MAG TPA: DUF1549 domain-containing protein [Gemmataceae bacterium]|nr:DUF1549 domain-containing protein [Gemmataceae bacterium]
MTAQSRWRGGWAAVTAGLVLLAGLSILLDRPSRAQAPRPDVSRTIPPVDGSDKVTETVQLINTRLEEGWKANKLTPSPLCSDYDFIRRASLDIIGRIARPEELQQFFRDPPQTRRALLIERLLKSEEYARNWANIWANWLLTRSGVFGRGDYREQMVLWLEDQLANNRPYDQMVRDLLTASGSNRTNGAVNFILAHVGEPNPPPRRRAEGQFEMVPITSRITRLFLGIQTQCVQCHDHPFDNNLKQEMFWGVNAYLRQVERRGNPPMQPNNRGNAFPELELTDNPNNNVTATVFYEKRNGGIFQARARFLDGFRLPEDPNQPPGPTGRRPPISGLARRAELANRIIEHEQFPKAIINRMWAHFCGRGFCMPLDDFNEQNPISYPELLDELAANYKHYGYDLKLLIRWICNSRLYHLSCQANATNDKADAEPYFSRMLLKALSPEELFESLTTATTPETADSDRAARREQREAWLNSLITNFGDDEGNEITFNGTVVQALMMMNGREINEAITRKDGMVAQVLKRRGNNVRAILNDLYLAALNRPPTDKEVQKILAAFPLYRGVKDRDPAAPFHDLYWALLNSSEFILNH